MVKIHDTYRDSYIWIIIHHTSSAVPDLGFGVHYALGMI